MVQLVFVCPIFVFLDEGSIVVLGAVVEQSPCLVKLKISMVPVVVLQEVHSEDITGPIGAVTAVGADWPGLGGLVGGWTSLTRSSPDESDSLSDLRNWPSLDGAKSDCASIVSFAGKQVFFKFHITGNFEVLVGCIPEYISLGFIFVSDEDHSSALWL